MGSSQERSDRGAYEVGDEGASLLGLAGGLTSQRRRGGGVGAPPTLVCQLAQASWLRRRPEAREPGRLRRAGSPKAIWQSHEWLCQARRRPHGRCQPKGSKPTSSYATCVGVNRSPGRARAPAEPARPSNRGPCRPETRPGEPRGGEAPWTCEEVLTDSPRSLGAEEWSPQARKSPEGPTNQTSLAERGLGRSPNGGLGAEPPTRASEGGERSRRRGTREPPKEALGPTAWNVGPEVPPYGVGADCPKGPTGLGPTA